MSSTRDCFLILIMVAAVTFVGQTYGQSNDGRSPKAASSSYPTQRLGFKGRPASDGDGVVIIFVYSGTPITRMRRLGDNSGRTWMLEKGDVITRINGQRVYSMADVAEALDNSDVYCNVTAYDPANETYRTYRARLR